MKLIIQTDMPASFWLLRINVFPVLDEIIDRRKMEMVAIKIFMAIA